MPDRDWNMAMPRIEPFYSSAHGGDGSLSIQPQLPTGATPENSPMKERPPSLPAPGEADAEGGRSSTPLVAEEDMPDEPSTDEPKDFDAALPNAASPLVQPAAKK